MHFNRHRSTQSLSSTCHTSRSPARARPFAFSRGHFRPINHINRPTLSLQLPTPLPKKKEKPNSPPNHLRFYSPNDESLPECSGDRAAADGGGQGGGGDGVAEVAALQLQGVHGV